MMPVPNRGSEDVVTAQDRRNTRSAIPGRDRRGGIKDLVTFDDVVASIGGETDEAADTIEA